jgi:hypothetical protein
VKLARETRSSVLASTMRRALLVLLVALPYVAAVCTAPNIKNWCGARRRRRHSRAPDAARGRQQAD